MSNQPKLNTDHAQMLLRMYTGQPELNHDTLTVTERQTLVDLRKMGYRVPKGGGYGLTEEGTTRVHQMMGWPLMVEAEVDTATVVAKEWLATAPMEHGTYLGEHDESGAVFKLDGVRMTGPSVADFASAGLVHPQATYNAFTHELVSRWNRGPVE